MYVCLFVWVYLVYIYRPVRFIACRCEHLENIKCEQQQMIIIVNAIRARLQSTTIGVCKYMSSETSGNAYANYCIDLIMWSVCNLQIWHVCNRRSQHFHKKNPKQTNKQKKTKTNTMVRNLFYFIKIKEYVNFICRIWNSRDASLTSDMISFLK